MIVKPIFVDTSALIAIGNKRDRFHRQAFALKDSLRQSNTHFVITNAVLLEFGSAFSSIALKCLAIKLIDAIRQSNKWKIVIIDENLTYRAIELYKKMNDKEWGLVDCSSIIVAKDMGIEEIFTADHHFEQAGFRILLK